MNLLSTIILRRLALTDVKRILDAMPRSELSEHNRDRATVVRNLQKSRARMALQGMKRYLRKLLSNP